MSKIDHYKAAAEAKKRSLERMACDVPGDLLAEFDKIAAGKKMDELTIVFPTVSDDDLSKGLRWLTRYACDVLGDDGSGGLGGEYGYGVNYENDVFMMHRFCWCEREDCPWCGGCDCPESSWHETHDPVCDYCRGVGVFSANGAEPGRGAPNFWHKPSGLKVWWYKYIGRGMAVSGSCPDLRAVLKECATSLNEEAKRIGE